MFLTPTIIVSVGRWGTQVSHHFLEYLDASFKLRQRESGLAERYRAPQDCFGRIAILRSRDDHQEWSRWPAQRVSWREAEQIEDGAAFRLDGSLEENEFWGRPRRYFEQDAESLFDLLKPKLQAEFARICSTGWKTGSEGLGVRVEPPADGAPVWVIVVGSIYEPEVGTVLRRFQNRAEEFAPALQAGARYLFLTDAGAPDSPAHPGQPWPAPPNWLAAEAFEVLTSLDYGFPCVVFYLSSPNRQGLLTPQSVREAAAAGLLRSLFWSELLDYTPFSDAAIPQGVRDDWDHLGLRWNPTDVLSERTLAFLEVALDTSNLPELTAREALARWKKRGSSPEAFHLTSEDFFQSVRNAGDSVESNPDAASGLVRKWMQEWAARGLPTSQALDFREFQSWLKAENDRDLDSIRALESAPSDAPAPAQAKRGILLAILVRLGPRKRPEPAAAASEMRAVKIRKAKLRIEFRNQLLSWVQFIGALVDEMDRTGSDFEDTRFDTHYSCDCWDDLTCVLRLRRLPLHHDCPPWIRETVDSIFLGLPPVFVESAFESGPLLDAFLSRLKKRIEDRVTELRESLEDAERRWEAIGLAQWVIHDPQLRLEVAKLVLSRFVPLWAPLPGKDWNGHLTVFEFGPASPLRADATYLTSGAAAWNAIISELRTLRSHTSWTLTETRPDPLGVFAADQVLWVRWPAMDSLGFLWAAFQKGTNDYKTSCNLNALREESRRWKAANPQKVPMILFARERDEDAGAD